MSDKLKSKKVRNRFSKEDIKYILTNWDSASINSIAIDLNRSEVSIARIVGKIRKAGYSLSSKRSKGNSDSLILDAIAEVKTSLKV